MTATTKTPSRHDRDAASLDLVRELLLESDRKHTAELVEDLEQRMRTELDRSNAALMSEIRTLTNAVDSRFADVDDAIDAAEGAREEEIEQQSARLEQTKRSLRTVIDRVDSECKQRAKSIRSRITATSDKLKEEGAAREARLLETIDAQVESVGSSSTSRHELSTLLAEVAEQLATDVTA